MNEQTVVEAAPSPAAEPSFEIPRSGTPEYAQWRMDGTLPQKEQPKKAEAAPADTSKETTSDDAGDSAPTTQEKHNKRRPDIEARFKQYTDRIDKLERDLEEARRPKETKADPSPAKPAQPQTYQEWRKTFKPKDWVEEYAKANPEASYEEANAAMADYLGDARDHFRSIEQQRQTFQRDTESKLNDARARYENFNEVAVPFVNEFVSDQSVSPVLKEMLNDSEVFADLAFTLAGKPDFKELAKTNPGKAIRYLAKVEELIHEELSKGIVKAESTRNEKGQFTAKEESPAKRGPESAPEPPIEIGNRGSGPIDESERAFKDIERGDFNATRNWLKAENAKDLRRRRGV